MINKLRSIKRVRRSWSIIFITLLCHGSCVDEETLSVYGLADQYEGQLSLKTGDCQHLGWSVREKEKVTLELKQTESAGLELWFNDSKKPIYAQLCRQENEQPTGLCLYGKQLETFQVRSANTTKPLNCLLWTEITGVISADRCCEQISMEAFNTLKITEKGGLKGNIERSLILESAVESENAEVLCGGPFACSYQTILSVEARP